MLAPLAKGADVGLVGVHIVVAPAGNPLIAQEAATAALGPLLVHVMVPATRAYYNLEQLWGAAEGRSSHIKSESSGTEAQKTS